MILKPCPFCGSKNVSLKHDMKKRDGKYQDCNYVSCKPCGARGSIFFGDPESAVERWNGMKLDADS